jgi:hypothetical protein
MRDRINALRLRLAGRTPLRAGVRWTAPAGFTAIERVMRRNAVDLSRRYTAHLSLQALWTAGATRHTQRIEWRRSRTPAVPAAATRHLERVLVSQQVLHERLLERLTRTIAPGAAPRVAHLTRVELRQAAPRTQFTMLRTQAVSATPTRAAAEPEQAAAREARPVSSQPRGIASGAPLVLPPQELSRLTDHVIRQLDHRILSWQERTGRV